jgi:hypothetical protein
MNYYLLFLRHALGGMSKQLDDLNAKTGKEIYRPTIGKYSRHIKSNDNGIRLINFAPSQNMVIGSTMSDHKDIHKMTWKSPDGNTFN